MAVAAALTQSLSWDLPYVAGAALKCAKKKKKNGKMKGRVICYIYITPNKLKGKESQIQKKGHFVIQIDSICKEDVTVLNLCTLNNIF